MHRYVRWAAQGWFLAGLVFYVAVSFGLSQGGPVGVLVTLEVVGATAVGVAFFRFVGTAVRLPISHWDFSSRDTGLEAPLVEFRANPSRAASLLFTVLPALAVVIGVFGLTTHTGEAAAAYPVGLVAVPFFWAFLLHSNTTKVAANDEGFVVHSPLGSTRARWTDIAAIDKTTVKVVPSQASQMVHQTSGQLPRSSKTIVVQTKDGRTVARLFPSSRPEDGLDRFLALAEAKAALSVGSHTLERNAGFLD